MTPSKKPKLSARTLLIQAAAVAAVVFVAWILSHRDQPERLRHAATAEAPQFGTVANGTIFRASDHNTGDVAATIRACPVNGVAEQILVQEDPRFSFASPPAVSISDGVVRYGVADGDSQAGESALPRPARPGGYPKPNWRGVNGAKPTGPLRYLGVFAQPPHGEAAPGTRTPIPMDLPLIETLHFRQVSERGGPVSNLATIRGTNLTIIRSHVFWNRPAPDNRFAVTLGSDEWTEVDGHTDLMLTDLATGTTRRVAGGLPSYYDLTAGNDGVFWTKTHPYPDRDRELFYAGAADGVVHHLGRIEPNQVPAWSVEDGGALYWFISGTRSDPAILMAADLKGGKVGPVFERGDPPFGGVAGECIGSFRGYLFLVVKGEEASRDANPLAYLCRIPANRHRRVEVLRQLPGDTYGYHFDRGYLYYNLIERERGLLQTISGDSAGQGRTNTLCRVPLPG